MMDHEYPSMTRREAKVWRQQNRIRRFWGTVAIMTMLIIALSLLRLCGETLD